MTKKSQVCACIIVTPNYIIINIQSKQWFCVFFIDLTQSPSFLCFITHHSKPAVLFLLSCVVVTFALPSQWIYLSA